MSIERWIFDEFNEIGIGLSFYRSFWTFWNMFGGLCTKVFYSWYMGKRRLKIILTKNQQSFVYIADVETVLATKPKIYS